MVASPQGWGTGVQKSDKRPRNTPNRVPCLLRESPGTGCGPWRHLPTSVLWSQVTQIALPLRAGFLYQHFLLGMGGGVRMGWGWGCSSFSQVHLQSALLASSEGISYEAVQHTVPVPAPGLPACLRVFVAAILLCLVDCLPCPAHL